FHVTDDLLFCEGQLYVPEKLRLIIMMMKHDSPLAGHFGSHKTKELVRRDYWWPKMYHTIESYVKSCDTCQRAKHSRKKQSGLLQPLEVPSDRWTSVTIDFMVELPECQGFNAIMVVVDRFTKMSHFIPCKNTITSEEAAWLYIDRVFRLHGIPEKIRAKHSRKKQSGLLQPLEVPSDRWTSVTIDFMVELPECQGFNAIMVVVDRFTKMSHFISLFRLHGIPEKIVSDRGTQFTAEFWTLFWKQMDRTGQFRVKPVSTSVLLLFTRRLGPFTGNGRVRIQQLGRGSRSVSDDPNVLAVKLKEYSEFLRTNQGWWLRGRNYTQHFLNRILFFGTLGDDFYKKLNSRSNLALILGVLKQYRSAEESDDQYTMHLWSQIDPIPNVAYKPCLLATTPHHQV
ncbi:retrotransposable element protein, partial [Planoprotostelium fungivorum]